MSRSFPQIPGKFLVSCFDCDEVARDSYLLPVNVILHGVPIFVLLFYHEKYLTMLLSGCTSLLGCGVTNPSSKPTSPINSAISRRPALHTKATLSSIRSSWRPHLEFKQWSNKCLLHQNISSASTTLIRGDNDGLSFSLPIIPTRRRPCRAPQASKDVPYSYRYPPMTKKPRWWWRTLACLPYLMPLHETWMYAETAYHLHPFLEDFEFLTYPFLGAIGRLPSWFLMAYFFVAYLGVVRRKEWPHFFRFHVVMGMLLEIALQVIGTVSRWMPLAVYWGKLGMHFWTAVAFAYLFTVLECIRCALAGMYADIPFVCDAAYIQIPYD
ncbi:hypothetical protein NL676_012405 [Syzygium grande]|nr:hypothetical protein NL676_012405 [Syzygium grande]